MDGKQAIQMFIQTCRREGVKVTPQRVAIFEVIQELGNHPSATEVHERLTQRFPAISFDTVNRTLLSFENMGIVQRVPGSGEVRRFDLNLEPHHHARCVQCGRILDIPAEPFDPADIPDALKDMDVLSRKTVYEVRCGRCRDNPAR